jgi:hypothetical protein
MTEEEHEAAKKVIDEKLKALGGELGQLTGEIMALENSPFCRAAIQISSFMGMANISIRVEIPPKEVLDKLHESVSPEELKQVMEDCFKVAKEQVDEEAKKPDEQVEDLLKMVRNRGNQN